MPDPHRFAGLLADYCLTIERGQAVLVSSTTLAAPLLEALHRALLEREAWPVMRTALPGLDAQFYEHARDLQLDGPSPVELGEVEAIHASLRIQAPENTRALSAADPGRIARVARGRAALKERLLQHPWCLTIWPTAALAQDAGMSTADYASFLERALFLDQGDPVAAWRELHDFQARLIERLREARELRIEAEGTDLTLDVTGRTWVNSDGKRNMPSGEVFTGPREDSASGRIRFTVPSSPAGVEVAGVDLRFEDGLVVDARAQRGDAYLQATLETDAGARRLGELGIGTNFGIDRPSGTILLDEKIGGTVHLALGRSYPETGGTNASAVHWDLICDLRRGGRLSADGDVIQEDGSFRL